MDQPRIAFMGAGAVGSYLGAFFTKAGYGPTLIDPWPEHVETMRNQGLRAVGNGGDFTVMADALHLTEVQNIREPFDIIFIAMKSYDTEWATHFIKRYLSPTGFMVCSQNSINDETIARIVGYERVVGLIMSTISVNLMRPGYVERGTPMGRDRGYDIFRAGEFSGAISPRLKQVAELMDCVDSSRVTTNLWGERWTKLASNCMGNTMTAMSAMAAEDLIQLSPRFPLLRDQVARELTQVGIALGVAIEPINGKPASEWAALPGVEALADVAPTASADTLPADRPKYFNPSTMQDVLKKRKTEIDGLNGLVSSKGREVGVPTPVNDAIVNIIRQIDAGTITPDPSNVDRVWDLAHQLRVAATA